MKSKTQYFTFKILISILIVVGALVTPSFSTLQRKTVSPAKSMSAAPTAKEVHSWAVIAKEKLPPFKAWAKAKPETENQRRLLVLFKRGHSIIDRAAARGETMSDAEAAGYDRQLRTVVEQIDKLSAGPASQQTQGSCFGSCDDTYHGWGHGKGWNRFWCKVSCFKIEVHVG